MRRPGSGPEGDPSHPLNEGGDAQLPAIGLTVLNAGRGLACALVGRLLEESGARVLHGSGARHGVDRYPGMALWAAADPSVSLEEHAGSADVVIIGGESVSWPDEPAADAGDLLHACPSAVILVIEGYLPGVEDPTPATDLLVQARMGMTGELFTAQPTPVAFVPTAYGAALLGALGVWAALLERLETGRGQVVRTTLQQGAALFWSHLWMRSLTPSPEFDRVPPRDVRHLVFRCADDRHVQLVLGVPHAMSRLYGALGVQLPDGTQDDRGVPDPTRGTDDYFAVRAPIASAIARLDSVAVMRRLAAAEIPAGVVAEAGETLSSEQAAANGLVCRNADGDRWGGRAVTVTSLGDAATTVGPRWHAASGAATSLEGLRIVDLGNWVAGPFATKLLADLGADVVSVDPPGGLSNLTGVRNVLAANRGKRSVIADLKAESGRRAVEDLIRTADVVCHNFRVGAAERLGLGVEALEQIRPGLVVLHTTAFGLRGPWASRGGFDMVGQALGGHEIRAGGEGNEPLWTRSPFIDYATGALGAIAVVAALHHRRRTSRAQLAHVSLLGTSLFLRSDCYVDADGVTHGQRLLDADRLGFCAAERIYATADGWLAVVVPDDGVVSRLNSRAALQLPLKRCDWDRGHGEQIASWLRDLSTESASVELAQIGVWSTPCRRDVWELLGNSGHPGGERFVIEAADGRYGRVRGVFGPQVSVGERPHRADHYPSAPLAGEHTASVLAATGTWPGSSG